MKEKITETRLSNGLTILTEQIPNLRSATLGFFLRQGSRDEPSELNGIYHFIEHTVFKGTKRRSALDIAIESDRLGGNLDAYTMHEQTGFSFHIVDKKIPEAFDLLADMLMNSTFDETELKREQKVIIEEMKMVEDSPEEFLGEIFQSEIYPDHALGLPIEGIKKTVKTFNQKTTAKFHRKNFTPENIVIACAGNVDHERIVELAQQIEGQKSESPKSKVNEPIFVPKIFVKKKRDLEQAHFILATPFVSATSENRYAATLLANILGGGTSSRLWQKIREERGLAYSVGSSALLFQDCGMFTLYAGTSPEKLGEVIDLSVAELQKIVHEDVREDELELVKEQALASILLSLESTGMRAGNLAQSEITHRRQIPIDETLQKLQAVTIEEIRSLAQEFFKTENVAFGALGNLGKMTVARERLAIN